MMAPFLVVNPVTREIEKRKAPYAGPVSEKAWRNYNRHFLKLHAGRYFYPEEPMDAYQEGVLAMTRAARKVAAGLELRKASPDTYVANAGRLALLNFHERRVLPIRRDYREVERLTAKHAHASLAELFDIDNFDPTDFEPSASMRAACQTGTEELEVPDMTAQELGELLPGIPNGATRIVLASSILEALFEKLPEETVRAFRGYIDADGNFVEAARIARISKTKYYRLWPRWIRTAREIGEKIPFIRH